MLKLLKALAALSAVVAVGLTNAAPILDQSNTSALKNPDTGDDVFPYPAIQYTNDYNQTAQQTLTVGLTGELARIDLALAKSSGFGDWGTGTIEIKTLADVVLASVNFNVDLLEEHPLGGPASFTPFDLSAYDVFASAGEVLKIFISHDAPGWLTWDFGGDYAGGESTVFVSGVPQTRSLVDFRFATYVEVCEPFPGGGNTGGCFPGPGPFPAPEPASLALVGLALAGLTAARRRKPH